MSNMNYESKLLIQFTSKSIRTRVNQIGKDLSKKYNISKERVRQIETKSLDILKSNILIA